jgi:hypothetical protein
LWELLLVDQVFVADDLQEELAYLLVEGFFQDLLKIGALALFIHILDVDIDLNQLSS